jgi:kinesin family protein 18/19
MSRRSSIAKGSESADEVSSDAEVVEKKDDQTIFVAVRVRPLWHSEQADGYTDICRAMDKVVIVMDPAYGKDNQDYLRVNRTREKAYSFDFVADSDVGQQQLYDCTAFRLVDTVINGLNASSMAYGATGAGKTFTMLGTERDPGIFVRTVHDLYEQIRHNSGTVYRVSLSYLEVYNENIRDLLNPGNLAALELREDPIKGVMVSGITETATSSAKEIMKLLVRGNMNRTVEPTSKNETSSRSHAVLNIVVEQQPRRADTCTTIKVGKLSLTDLAGSERATVSDNRGARLVEGANINRSLLALANCINALAARKTSHVPYRDSKLTRLLKDTFGGNCKTVMIANISPASNQFEETTNTLKYAHRARSIKTKISATIKNVDSHISEYKRIILSLQAEVLELKAQLGQEASARPRLPMVSEARSGDDEARSLAHELEEVFSEAEQLALRTLELEEGLQGSRIEAAVKLAELKAQSQAICDLNESSASTVQLSNEAHAELTLEFEQAMTKKSELLSVIQQRVMESQDTRTLLRQRIESMATKTSRKDLLLQFRNRCLQLENSELTARLKMRDRLTTRLFNMQMQGSVSELSDLATSSYSVTLQQTPELGLATPSRVSEAAASHNANASGSMAESKGVHGKVEVGTAAGDAPLIVLPPLLSSSAVVAHNLEKSVPANAPPSHPKEFLPDIKDKSKGAKRAVEPLREKPRSNRISDSSISPKPERQPRSSSRERWQADRDARQSRQSPAQALEKRSRVAHPLSVKHKENNPYLRAVDSRSHSANAAQRRAWAYAAQPSNKASRPKPTSADQTRRDRFAAVSPAKDSMLPPYRRSASRDRDVTNSQNMRNSSGSRESPSTRSTRGHRRISSDPDSGSRTPRR